TVAEAPALFADWDLASERVRLRMVGPLGTTWRVMASTGVRGPWSLLRGILLGESEVTWTIQNQPDAQFYTVVEAEPRDVEPLASNFRLIDLEGEARELFYFTHRDSIVVIAAGDRLENVARSVSDLNALATSPGATNSEIWVMLSDAVTPR